ncbi:MAG: hypothetical protein HC796_01260 [Synechococcaceae cyanobacterium RL_1_2]|nr:hypothetical protein [Synechococcaceae cyanobacterium RL_1_2]
MNMQAATPSSALWHRKPELRKKFIAKAQERIQKMIDLYRSPQDISDRDVIKQQCFKLHNMGEKVRCPFGLRSPTWQ